MYGGNLSYEVIIEEISDTWT